ncbi:uncharacterized protein [Macrobrachium rosenbergii]|uniref:uncharacterized protein isoform X2 n=1 Tax=Macrobrachium rosenbergii TaxID=79674 RepID=UPI0034D79FA6
MARASVGRYRWLSGASFGLLLADLICNSLFLLFYHDTLITLLIYIIQDVFLVFSLILFFLALFSTSLSQWVAYIITYISEPYYSCLTRNFMQNYPLVASNIERYLGSNFCTRPDWKLVMQHMCILYMTLQCKCF